MKPEPIIDRLRFDEREALKTLCGPNVAVPLCEIDALEDKKLTALWTLAGALMRLIAEEQETSQ